MSDEVELERFLSVYRLSKTVKLERDRSRRNAFTHALNGGMWSGELFGFTRDTMQIVAIEVDVAELKRYWEAEKV